MLVLRGVMWCLSLPFFWLGQLTAMLKMPLSVPLLKAAWFVGGDGQVAVLALSCIQRHGSPELARAQAGAWLAHRPCTEIAAMAGLLAVEAERMDEARELLARGQQLGPDAGGLLELLEINIGSRGADVDAFLAMSRRLEDRKDLSPAVAKIIHQELLWRAMLDGRFEEAQRRAKWLWSIEDDPVVAVALWALAKRRGRNERLDESCDRMGLSASRRLFYQTLGLVAIGGMQEARQTLTLLAEADRELAEAAREYFERKEKESSA